MSPTLLAHLRAIELAVKRWQSASYGVERRAGCTAYACRYYSARSCWPDSLTMMREGLRY